MRSLFAGLKRASLEMGFTARNTRATGACVCLVPTSNRDEEPTRKSHDESVLLLCQAEVLFSVTNWTVIESRHTEPSRAHPSPLVATQGEFAEAEALYERCQAIEEKALGPDHPSLATTLCNRAGLLEKQVCIDGVLEAMVRCRSLGVTRHLSSLLLSLFCQSVSFDILLQMIDQNVHSI